MATYRFNWLSGGAEMIDPIITVVPDGMTVYPSTMKIDVDILLESGGNKFGIRLEDVSVDTLNYNPGNMYNKVLTHLEQYLV